MVVDDMATPSRRIYNRNASAHINVVSNTPPPPLSPDSPSLSAATVVPATSVTRANVSPSTLLISVTSSNPPPTTLPASVPVGAKKKKKKRTKGKTSTGPSEDVPPLVPDEDLDFGIPAYEDEGQDLTDDDIPDLVDIHSPATGGGTHGVPMTANSSGSSKTQGTMTGGGKKKKKKKGKGGVTANDDVASLQGGQQPEETGLSQQKIWNTTTAEEKERIKEFWLGLSEQDRRNLVRIEKEHVSKRVKEGSKILNCSCHVCGRKQYAACLLR
jgi:Salt tolerance down-regulator